MNTARRGGYTLIEILVSVTLMLLLMLGVTQLFSSIGTTINEAQSTLGMTANLRTTKDRLSKDLAHLTVRLDPLNPPPVAKGTNAGYFCIIEGMGAAHSNALLRTLNGKNPSESILTRDIALNSDSDDVPESPSSNTIVYDNTVGDMDDVLMFTAGSPPEEKFRGRCGPRGIIESNTAEIIWFCRGNTLYRRVLLVSPNANIRSTAQDGFYNFYDISARYDSAKDRIVANTLEDLARRENRYAHGGGLAFPYDIHDNAACYYLRMPTLIESSTIPNPPARYNWDISLTMAQNYANTNGTANPDLTYDTDLIRTLTQKEDAFFASARASDLPKYDVDNTVIPPRDVPKPFIDYWHAPLPWREIDPETGNIDTLQSSTRYAEDVILTNVLSFDVQVWDPDVNRFVNLGEASYNSATDRWFYADEDIAGNKIEATKFGTQGRYPLLLFDATGVSSPNPEALPCVYDTWTDTYEIDRIGATGVVGGVNQLLPNGKDQIDKNYDRDASGNITGIVPRNGIDDNDEWSTPPPYWDGLRGIKITIRTFDPKSRNVREMSIVHSFVQ